LRFLIDANLSPVVAARLRDDGHDAVHVADVGLLTASDEAILSRAGDEERVVISADSDFGTLLAVGHLSKPSFVLSYCGQRITWHRVSRPTSCSATSRRSATT